VENYFYLDAGWGYVKVTAVPKRLAEKLRASKTFKIVTGYSCRLTVA
jgi:hypothetical protein